MNTELQNKAWSVLPKEFKEEVKKLYREFAFTREGYYVELFGLHNLTSDAEGETELLTVTRQKVMGLYANAKKIHNLYTSATCVNANENQQIDICIGIMSVLDTLFGSKCLPDLSENLSEQKPAEPKFKIGDKVKHSAHPHDDGIYRVDDIKKSSDEFIYHIQGLIGISNVKESDLELYYTEPKEESRNLSQETANCDKQFDNILKDSFRNERRLNIAAMAMQGILSNPQLLKIAIETYQEEIGSPDIYVAVAKTAKAQADALIAECEQTEKLKEN